MHSKTITVDDFRGVSISLVLSKVLEHCILDRYCDFLGTSVKLGGGCVVLVLGW